MNPNSFENYKVFNYSAVAMRPQEYKVFIDFAIKDSNQPIDTIILAVDFFGYLDNKLFKYNQGPKIIENTKSLPSFIDNKVLNRQKVYQEVETIKEIEVIKEVKIPVYPDFYINMSDLNNSNIKNLFIVPFKALKFIIKWNYSKWRTGRKEKK